MVEQPRHYGYILRGERSGLYKVGITKNIGHRLSSYRTHIPERISQEETKSFISTEEARDWEKLALYWHKDSIEHGEWLGATFREMARTCTAGNPAISEWIADEDLHLVVVSKSVGSILSDSEAEELTRVFRCSDSECAEEMVVIMSEFLCTVGIIEAPRFIDHSFISSYRSEQRASRERCERYRRRVRALLAEFPSAKKPDGFDQLTVAQKLSWLDEKYPEPSGPGGWE